MEDDEAELTLNKVEEEMMVRTTQNTDMLTVCRHFLSSLVDLHHL